MSADSQNNQGSQLTQLTLVDTNIESVISTQAPHEETTTQQLGAFERNNIHLINSQTLFDSNQNNDLGLVQPNSTERPSTTVHYAGRIVVMAAKPSTTMTTTTSSTTPTSSAKTTTTTNKTTTSTLLSDSMT